VARKNSVVHTDYTDIAGASIDDLIFTHNPDNLTAWRPILTSGKRLVLRNGKPYEAVKGSLFPFDADGQLLLPIRPTQLLWINLAAAVTLALPLAFEDMERDVMARPPRAAGEPIVSRFVLGCTVAVAALMAAASLGLFTWEYGRSVARGVDPEHALGAAQTMAVTTVVAFQAFYMLSCRSLRDPLWAGGLRSNPAVLPGLAAIALLQAALLYLPPLQAVFGTEPLSPRDVAASVAAGALVVPLVELEKWWTRRRRTRAPDPAPAGDD
jgi:Ca2+-transporting ATPase